MVDKKRMSSPIQAHLIHDCAHDIVDVERYVL